MERPYLIQRLEKPQHFVVAGKAMDNPFSFGGAGYKDGGFSAEAMDLLRPIFSFDYMGAAEYEFGDVPKALSKILDRRKSFAKITVAFKAKDIEKPWRDEDKKRVAKLKGPFKVYAFCRKSDATEVEEFIRADAKGGKKRPRIRDATMLNASIRPVDEWSNRRKGWLVIGEDPFMFFVDEEMCDKVVKLFGTEDSE